jgi:hypothetical protein
MRERGMENETVEYSVPKPKDAQGEKTYTNKPKTYYKDRENNDREYTPKPRNENYYKEKRERQDEREVDSDGFEIVADEKTNKTKKKYENTQTYEKKNYNNYKKPFNKPEDTEDQIWNQATQGKDAEVEGGLKQIGTISTAPKYEGKKDRDDHEFSNANRDNKKYNNRDNKNKEGGEKRKHHWGDDKPKNSDKKDQGGEFAPVEPTPPKEVKAVYKVPVIISFLINFRKELVS